ncbi:hypothetical protein PINS_up022510 [Pythium insidiosum]|nr:hypothetical protein PINS_up022510 [Pythium insidiosum]
MVIYVSLPHGIKADKLPFVIVPPWCPWARDHWGYNSLHQHFANRGYGCISVNFRGSTGYGKHWLHLGDLQWGDRMQQDLTDTVEWAIKQGLADPERVAIFGGSYGGYAALAGLTFTSDVYACAVDIVGPSHVKTLFQSFPPYWAVVKQMFVLRVGDAENDEELNQKISPLFHVDKIKKPLLIAQGANDPRVKQAESDQIAKKMLRRSSTSSTCCTRTRATALHDRRTDWTLRCVRRSFWRSISGAASCLAMRSWWLATRRSMWTH